MRFQLKNTKFNLQFFHENLLHEYNSYEFDKKTLSIESSEEDYKRLIELYAIFEKNETLVPKTKSFVFQLANNEQNRLFFKENVNYYDTFFSNCLIQYQTDESTLKKLNKLYQDTQKQKK